MQPPKQRPLYSAGTLACQISCENREHTHQPTTSANSPCALGQKSKSLHCWRKFMQVWLNWRWVPSAPDRIVGWEVWRKRWWNLGRVEAWDFILKHYPLGMCSLSCKLLKQTAAIAMRRLCATQCGNVAVIQISSFGSHTTCDRMFCLMLNSHSHDNLFRNYDGLCYSVKSHARGFLTWSWLV